MTQKQLQKILSYSKSTGKFKWIIPVSNHNRVRKKTASFNKFGYGKIQINKKAYFVHNLAWLYVTGKFPKNLIDHINGNPSDNRFCNLREVTYAQNSWNRIAKGYIWYKRDENYMATITAGGVKYFLGYHKTKKLAHSAYIKAKEKYHGKEFCKRIINANQ